jgi:hypothetical protein
MRLYEVGRSEAREIASCGCSKSDAIDRDSKSLHQDRQGSGSDRGHRVDQEALAVG